MRIIELRSENVKRLKAVAITPEPHVNTIGGMNGSGKTSLLDSISYALGGGSELPEVPVRIGEEKAQIILKLDDGLTVKRTFTAAGGTSLVVENSDGARYPSPQAMLDKLTGKLCFDPFAFTRLSPKDQAAALKKLVGLDVSELDARRAALYNERTLVNRDVGVAAVEVQKCPFHADAPAELVSTIELVAKLSEIRAHNEQKAALEAKAAKATANVTAAKKHRDQIATDIQSLEAALEKKRAELVWAEKGLTEADAASEKAKGEVNAFVPQDEAPVKKALGDSGIVNAKVEANRRHADAKAAWERAKTKSSELSVRIDEIDAEKARLLAEAKFPISGLSFTEAGVTYNGVPFAQASAAEQLRVSVAMGAALNPKLRVAIVRDGSLLDSRSMELLAKLAEEHNLQVFIEVAGDGDGCTVVIEEGEVKGAFTIPADA